MKVIHKFIALLLLINLSACSDNTPDVQPPPLEATGTEKTDVVELQKLINLPITPTKVVWEINKVTEPSSKYDREDWSVVARMELTEKDFKILSNVPMPIKVIKFPKYAVEPWMEDIIATKFKPDDTGDFYTPRGTVLSAEQFYKDPLVTGAIYMISETEILLYVQTE